MRSRKPLCRLAAGLALAAAFLRTPAAAAPDWSDHSLNSDAWCLVQFTDEFGERHDSDFWAYAGKCCVDYAAGRTGVDDASCQGLPLYHVASKANSDVSKAPYYEAADTAYKADMGLGAGTKVTRDGLAVPMRKPFRLIDPLGGAKLVVVHWTGKAEAAPDSPMSLQSHDCGPTNSPAARFPASMEADIDAAAANFMYYVYDRFLSMEKKLVEDVRLLKARQIGSLLSCPKDACGDIGGMSEVTSANALLINDYAKKLRAIIREDAGKLRQAAAKASDKTRFSELEADFIACGVAHAQLYDRKTETAFLASLKKASSDAKERDKFLSRWRGYTVSELELYLKDSDGLTGAVKEVPKTANDGLTSRTAAVAEGKDLAEVYAKPGEKGSAKQGDAKSKVNSDKIRAKVNKAVKGSGTIDDILNQ